MLHNGSLPNDLAGMILNVGLMKWVRDVVAGGREVRKIRYHDKVEIVVEMSSVIATRHG